MAASSGPPERFQPGQSTTGIAAGLPTPRSDTEQLDSDARGLGERFRSGDVGALSDVYRLTAPLVFTIARRTLASQPDAEDVTQRVYLQAWRSRGTYDPTRRPLRAWLVGITRHVVADKIAERARQLRLEQRLGESGRVEQASDDGIAERIADAIVVADGLSQLDQPRRQVVEMSFFEGLTHTQISETLGLPPGTVKSHIKRGLAQLRRQLGVSDGAS